MENEKEKLKIKIQNLIKEKKELKIQIEKLIKEKNIKSMFELSLRFPWYSDKFNYLELIIPNLILNYNNFEKQWIESQETFKEISKTLIEQKNRQNNQKIKNF